MPLSVSETSLVSSVSPIHLENSEIVLREDGDSTVLDVEEYVCTNREVVNLENAALNIDNSNDVIIGPVTQFNVNGNVTIYHNGTREQETVDDTSTDKDEKSNNNSNGSAKLGKSGKTESEELDLRSLNKRTKYIKIILLVSLALTVVVGIIFTAIFYTQRHEDTADDDVPSDPGDNEDNNIGNHQILDRTQWNGRPPIRIRNITAPVPLVVIKHTGGGTCTTFRVCAGKLQTIQSQAVGDGADDIYYNFLIGGDENIYVGRGWDVQPAQRDNIIDIVFMGSFTFDVPTAGMIEAAKLLIEDGAQKGKLTDDYKVVCHSQTETTESPGLHLIEEVKTWPHYDPGSYRSRSLKASSKSSARVGGS